MATPNTKPIFWSEKIPYLKKMKGFYSKMSYKGIPLWPIMATEIYTFYKNQEIGKFERILKEIKYLFVEEKYLIQGEKGKTFVTYFMPRKDHHKLVFKTIEKFPKKEITLLDCYNQKKQNPFLRGSFKFPNLFLLFKIWNKFRKAKVKKTLGKYYSLFLTRTYSRHKEIKNFYKIYNKYSPKAHISFCSSSFAEETIFTLICKKHKIPTFTLQHGFFTDFEYFTPPVLQMENNVADYLLVWGKTSYDIQKKYTEKSRILVVGNPKYSLRKNKIKKIFSPKIATIFLSVTQYPKSNEKIVRIVNEFAKKHPEIKFQIKIHPFDNVKNYEKIVSSKNIVFMKIESSVSEVLEKSDFAILHNTSISYEALLYNLPIFRFEDEFMAKVWEHEDTFNDMPSLEKLFLKVKNPKMFKQYLSFYNNQLKETFYFHPTKSVPQVYYEKIMEKIK